jgi:hypothetical protein
LDAENPHKRIIERMARAALKEKLNHLARKYDQKYVFDIWVELEKRGGAKPYASKLLWKPEMTIAQALECLDTYCHSMEAKIREKCLGKKE